MARSNRHTRKAAVARHMPFTEVGTTANAIAETNMPNISNTTNNGRTVRGLSFDASLDLRLAFAIIAPCNQQPKKIRDQQRSSLVVEQIDDRAGDNENR
jgi:hypothetical protein